MNDIDLVTPSTACVHMSQHEITVPGARVVPVDMGEGTVLAAIARALSFPAHFGHNQDALIDCLRDVDDRALVLVVRDATRVFQERPHEVGALIETWVALADEHVKRKVARHLVFVW
jgi:RNAse (barnase) inhibitor barstar